jgi:hypothetical protein
MSETIMSAFNPGGNFEGAQQQVHAPVAESDGAFWPHLVNERWQPVRIIRSGWTFIDDLAVC